jgi:CRP-like cAMP-binding protein
VSEPVDPKANDLLAVIGENSWPHWRRVLEVVELQAEQTLAEPGGPFRHLYFPVGCTVSSQVVLGDGASIQTCLIGQEGVVGLELLFGVPVKLRHVVLSSGTALRALAAAVVPMAQRDGAFMSRAGRYGLDLMAQAAQAAACGRHHTPEQHLCSLLLALMDHLQTVNLVLTHDLLSRLMGVRRETITQAAQKLQARGLVRYRRGHMHVLDRSGIEHVACECYGSMKALWRR